MKIAIPMANGKLSMHFGHCEKFKIFTVDTDTAKIEESVELVPPPHEPGVLPKWLAKKGADVIIAGGMGMRAQTLFQQQNIEVITGAPAESPEDIVKSFMNGTLHTGDNVCDH